MFNNIDDVKVQIILPNYNKCDFLEEAIESVINQTYKKFDDYTDPTFREWRNKKSAEFLIENIVEPKYFSQLLCISEDTKAFLQKNTQISVEVRKNLALY